MSTLILLHKHKSKSQKSKQVSNERLKPLKKQVSKLASALRNISEGAAANLPSLDALKINICHVREERNMLSNPQTREEIPVLPQEYQLTTNGNQFLVFDSGIGNPERIFIFASDLGLQCLYECDHWYADGTFKVCPKVFY